MIQLLTRKKQEMSKMELEPMLCPVRQIVDYSIPKAKESGRNRRFTFVTFATKVEAMQTILF